MPIYEVKIYKPNANNKLVINQRISAEDLQKDYWERYNNETKEMQEKKFSLNNQDKLVFKYRWEEYENRIGN